CAGRVDGEVGGAHGAVVLEVEEQPVSARCRHFDGEEDAWPRRGYAVARRALRVHAQVTEVGGMEGDEVPVGTEIGLQVTDGLPVLGDRRGHQELSSGHEFAVQTHLIFIHSGHSCGLMLYRLVVTPGLNVSTQDGFRGSY